MVSGRVDPTVHEFLPRDRVESTALSQQPPVRPTDGRTPRPAMNPVHPAHVHRAPRPEWRTVTPRIGGRARHGHGRGPGDESGAHATGDRAPDDPSPGMQSTTTAGWADPRRAGPCAMPPTRLIPGAAAATPRPAGPAGPEDPAPARSVPARPRGADGQPDPPPPRSRGPRRARGLDAASGRPRVDPAAAVGPFGPVEEPDNDDGRRVLPPPGRRGPGTAPPGAAAGPGCLHPPAHGPDGAVASSAADAAVFRAHPDPRAKKTTASFRNPFPTRAPRSSALARPIPACPSAVTASAPRPGCPLRHPVTRSPTACTTGPYDPATPATGPDPGRSRERPAP